MSTEKKPCDRQSPPGSLSRRGILIAGASASMAALTGLPAITRSAAAAAQQGGQWQPRLLSPEQGRLLARLCDLLLPRTATPGALDCGVPEWIDLRLSLDDPETQLAFLGGLTWIDRRAATQGGSSFLQLDEDQQTALLHEISDENESHPPELEAGAAFFSELKEQTLFAYFTSQRARVETLGLPERVQHEEFRGCDHGNGEHRD